MNIMKSVYYVDCRYIYDIHNILRTLQKIPTYVCEYNNLYMVYRQAYDLYYYFISVTILLKININDIYIILIHD